MFKKTLLFKTLSIVISISFLGFAILIYKVISQEKESLLEERRKTSELMAQPILHTIYKDMLDERADMARYIMEGMKAIKGIERAQIIRSNGAEEAFQDFKTLKAVEKEYGELKPEWTADHPNVEHNVAKGIDTPKFKEAFRLFKEGSKEGVFYIEESEGKRLSTYLVPIEAKQKCNACHVEEGMSRGILMISTSLEDMYASLSYSRMQWIIYGLFTILGVSVLLIAFMKTITNPLGKIAEYSKKIAYGDIDISLDIKSNDEIGVLANAFKEMIDYLKSMANTAKDIAGGDIKSDVVPKSEKDALGNAFREMIVSLRGLIGQIRNGSEQVASASSEIAATADQSSKNSESAATSVEEITSTMHEMSANIQNVAKSVQSQSLAVTQTSSSIEELIASIQRVAENARNLAELSQKSSDAVILGNNAVDKSSSSMNDVSTAITSSANTIKTLSSRAENIGKIVEVIDDIAEQTNLLSLNAAIEAARAGEQGLGFAVVAEEVRKLAERSAKSTKEIAELIAGIQKDSQMAVKDMGVNVSIVNQALKLSEDVVKSLQKIYAAVNDVSKYSQEISAATHEQASGCDDISKALIKLNEITQEVSASADEQTSGTQEVVKAVEKLRDMVQQNASAATELAASAEELSRQSDTLSEATGRFSIDSSGRK